MRLFFYLLAIFFVPFAEAHSFPDPNLPKEEVLATTPGLTVYHTKVKGRADGKFAVYVPSSYRPNQPMPLVVSAHGSGADGEKEARLWKDLPEQYKFILVCPSYYTSSETTPQNIAIDETVLQEVMARVLGSFNINRRKVLHTGLSGGSLSTWYLAAKHDEWFTALCTRSGNFDVDPDINLLWWRNRPIYIMWGEKDRQHILDQGPLMLNFVRNKLHNTKLKFEIIPGGGHEGHPDMVAKWFSGLTDVDLEPLAPDAPIH
jgi:predicted peptidase